VYLLKLLIHILNDMVYMKINKFLILFYSIKEFKLKLNLMRRLRLSVSTALI